MRDLRVGTLVPFPPGYPSRNQPAPPRVYRPGSLVAAVLLKLGYTQYHSCGCAEFEAKMNAWGWRKCAFKHRAEIVAWFIAKAKEQGIEVSGATVWSLVRAGMKELRKKKTRRSITNAQTRMTNESPMTNEQLTTDN
jgi:hypothetical protein